MTRATLERREHLVARSGRERGGFSSKAAEVSNENFAPADVLAWGGGVRADGRAGGSLLPIGQDVGRSTF